MSVKHVSKVMADDDETGDQIPWVEVYGDLIDQSGNVVSGGQIIWLTLDHADAIGVVTHRIREGSDHPIYLPEDE